MTSEDTGPVISVLKTFTFIGGGLMVCNNLNPAHPINMTNSYCFRRITSTVVTGGSVIQQAVIVFRSNNAD